jgi:hypothetical protein
MTVLEKRKVALKNTKILQLQEYIKDVWRFEVVTCAIPKNNFEYFKRWIYLKIYERNKKLFYFIRDKVWPIKFLDERPDGSLWFQKRSELGNLQFEIEIMPVPPEVTNYITCTKSVFKPVGNCFKVKIYQQGSVDITGVSLIKTFPVSETNLNESFNLHLSDFPELKQELREYTLNKVLMAV